MIKLQKLSYISVDIFNACTNNMHNGTRKDHILASKNAIVNARNKYDELALQGKLTSLAVHKDVVGGATKGEMVWLYDKKFVADGGRKYYDKIMLLPSNGICPFCAKRFVATLDHYLPKTKYPTFAIVPENLVASCSDCNKGKNSDESTDIQNSVIHPYYDDFEDEIWIEANIIEDFPIGFNFRVVKPKKWSQTKFERAQVHFEIFKLGKLYSSHAAEVFTPYAIQLKRLYKRYGEVAIEEDLIDRIESQREFRINSIEAALYEALLNNKWFFDTYMPEKIKDC